jgi:hypothetical protein
MWKNIVDDPIPVAEMACALLAMSATMTDREAAKAAGLNPDSAPYILSKPRVQAFMLAHGAKLQEKLAAEQAEGQTLRNLSCDRALTRLWELANLSPEATRGSIAGQVKAMSMIVAIEGLIPDRRQPKTPTQPATPLPKPQIYVAEWLREQKEREAQGKDPADVVAGTETQPETAEAPEPKPASQPATEPASNASAAGLDQNQASTSNRESGSWVPDAASGRIFDPRWDPNDPRAPLWMRMKKRRR